MPRSVQKKQARTPAKLLCEVFAKFIDRTGSLYSLLCKSTKWQRKVPRNCSRGSEQEAGSSLSCDASLYWVGVVLSHVKDDNFERPIGHASRTLSVVEKNYSQGIKHWRSFLV